MLLRSNKQAVVKGVGGLFLSAMMWLSHSAAHEIDYSTRSENVEWVHEGNKFYCRLSHAVERFGSATFDREAGEKTRFVLSSKSPRMMTGNAYLISRPPAWSAHSKSTTIAMVKAKEGLSPIKLKRKLSERMLAELQKGMLLVFRRQPWYGDPQTIQVTLSSIGFLASYEKYLNCLDSLLPVNFKQIEKSSLLYSNDDEDLTDAVKKRLDVIVEYANADETVKTFYLDGHTDSEGIRNENLIKSQRRTERVMDYLIEKGIARERIVARWHGERYQVANNRTASGRAKNRRVTVRVSKELPQTLVESGKVED